MRPQRAYSIAERAGADEVPVGYRMTGLGLLPHDWAIVRLGELATIRYGKAKPRSLESVPVIGSGGVCAHAGEALVNEPTIVLGRKGTAGGISHRIQPSDLVILPLKTRGAIAIGRASGPYRHRPDLPAGAHHTLPVQWIRPDSLALPSTRISSTLLAHCLPCVRSGATTQRRAFVR